MAKRGTEEETGNAPKRRRNEGPVPPLFKVFHCEVASVKEYGIFVKIPGTQRQGLVHKSQISKSKVDDPSDMFARGEYVYCKVISINDDGEKIGLAMKMVNQTTGQDLDPNNVELSQDEKKRKQFGNKFEKQKIVLDAVFDTTCKKCGGKGHLAQDCFKTGEGSYDLIPDLDDYMKTVGETETASHKKKKKEKKKSKHKKKEKKKKQKKANSSSDTESSDDDHRPKKPVKKHRQRAATSSDSSDSDHYHSRKQKRSKERRHRKSSSSGESDGHQKKIKKRDHKRKKKRQRSSSLSSN